MQEVPRKNLEAVLVDVKHPAVDYTSVAQSGLLDVRPVKVGPPVRRGAGVRRVIIGLCVLTFVVVSGVAGAGVLFFDDLASLARERTAAIAGNIVVSAESLKGLEPEKARARLQENKETLGEIEMFLGKVRADRVAGSLGGIIPAVKDSLGLIKTVSRFNFDLLDLTESILDLQTNGFRYFREDGHALIRGLRRVQATLAAITRGASEITNATARLDQTFDFLAGVHEKVSGEYLAYASQFHLWSGALDAFAAFLDTKVDKHIALIFHNPSELRPAGGFIGSYGDLTINEGRMVNLDVQDIYWPDHPMNFDRKVMPPEPLRSVTEDWGARDGNWFFDFPTSAETVLGFLESSKIYKEDRIRFEGVLAINTNVLKTLLEFVGPISVPEYGMTITADNFLPEIQREVETGRDKQEKKNPKKILSVITPRLMEGLGAIPPEKRKALFQRFGDHFAYKDIMVYMRGREVQTLMHTLGVDGAVYELPYGFWGSYLGVVSGNVAGGKSDIFVKEAIEARIDVAGDGGSFTDLAVTRTHNGKNERDWWYRADNKTYTQVFTESGTRLVAVEGGGARRIPRKTADDYAEEGYEVPDEVRRWEENTTYLTDLNAWSSKILGKSVFGAWFDTPAGESKTLRLRYVTDSGRESVLYEGKKYQFIFEKQSGRDASLKVTVTAPLGYVWKESNDAVFVFQTVVPKSREVMELTLMRK